MRGEYTNGHTDPPLVGLMLPKAKKAIEKARLESADLIHRICIHELIEGIAIASGVDPDLEEVPPAVVDFAQRVMDTMDALPPCPHRAAL